MSTTARTEAEAGGVHDVINRLTDEYAEEHNVQNQPLDA